VRVLSSLFTNVALDLPVAEPPADILAAIRGRLESRELEGKLKPESIRLRIRGLLSHRPYQPVFLGALDTTATPTRLRGGINSPVLLKAFTWSWMGFALIWTIAALVTTQLQGALYWLPLAGVLMLALGYAFFRLVNKFVTGQAHRLEALLRDIIAKSPNTSFERTREG
jgi:hypothetical protein